MTIKTWHDRIMELEDGVIVTSLHVTRYMQAEIDDLRKAVKSLAEDAEQWRTYKARRDAVIAAGMGRNALRREQGEAS